MMRHTVKAWILALAMVGAVSVAADSPSLEKELDSLSVPANQAPAGVGSEKLYAVQNRYSPLRLRHEISLGGSKYLNSEFLTSHELSLGYRFYLTNRWYLGLSGSYVFNAMSGAGHRLLAQEALLPDVAFAKSRADLMVGFHAFYGKFRLTMDQVFYFDQYIALGAGLADMDRGRQGTAVADVGFVFWLGRTGSVRIGVKDYYLHEYRRLSDGWTHNFLAHLDIGIVLGGSEGI